MIYWPLLEPISVKMIHRYFVVFCQFLKRDEIIRDQDGRVRYQTVRIDGPKSQLVWHGNYCRWCVLTHTAFDINSRDMSTLV